MWTAHEILGDNGIVNHLSRRVNRGSDVTAVPTCRGISLGCLTPSATLERVVAARLDSAKVADQQNWKADTRS